MLALKHKTSSSTSIDQSAFIWKWDSEANTVECVSRCCGHSQSVECVAVDQLKGLFVTGSWDTRLKVWAVGELFIACWFWRLCSSSLPDLSPSLPDTSCRSPFQIHLDCKLISSLRLSLFCFKSHFSSLRILVLLSLQNGYWDP